MSDHSEDREKLLLKVRNLPHRPGVYIHKDLLGRIIYVGKARDLKKRVSSYFQSSRLSQVDRKTSALMSTIADFDIHIVQSEAEAVLLEGKLIKEYRPRFNVSFKDDKRFLLVRVRMEDEIPRFTLTRFRKEDGARYFGPFIHSNSVRKTLRLMNVKFRLRQCAALCPGERDFKHCLDHLIQNCSAPCVGKISREDYRKQVELACEFLDGKTKESLVDIEKEMQKAADNLEFEKAASLRDTLDNLRKTTAPVKRFIREFKPKLDPTQDVLELQKALQLAEPPKIMECFDISNISDNHKVASMIHFENGLPEKSQYRKYRIVGVKGQDDFASIAEAVRRRYSRVLQENLEKPGLIIVDGGKGQLSSAVEELKQLNLTQIPIIGLAKENEEIYLPARSFPIILPKSSGALKLLQRIRDEAHRFANKYNELLYRQKMTESLLDDCPGISAHRKKLLLSHFGSVERIKKATAKEIAGVAGIGSKTAQTLFDFFHSKKESS
ncbi:MAG: excinuclease ABC subunit UvrC [Verrucomicrobiota bacterium]